MSKRKKSGGRKKGVPNRMTLSLKDTLLSVLEELGGPEFIRQWAEVHKTEFMIIISKLLPRQPLMEIEGPTYNLTVITGVPDSEAAPRPVTSEPHVFSIPHKELEGWRKMNGPGVNGSRAELQAD